MRAGGDDVVAAQGPLVRDLGCRDYRPVWEAMRAFTQARDARSADELWVVEHPSVFTLGLNAKPEHVLEPGDIPVIRTDRGGQVTYHGPGQVVIYLLCDLRRLGLGVRALVGAIEEAAIAFLAARGVAGVRRAGAPGVFVAERKIAALGLRVRRGCSYHGLSFNVDMDLAPFARINPCGYAGLEVTQLSAHDSGADWSGTARGLCVQLVERLGYNRRDIQAEIA